MRHNKGMKWKLLKLWISGSLWRRLKISWSWLRIFSQRFKGWNNEIFVICFRNIRNYPPIGWDIMYSSICISSLWTVLNGYGKFSLRGITRKWSSSSTTTVMFITTAISRTSWYLCKKWKKYFVTNNSNVVLRIKYQDKHNGKLQMNEAPCAHLPLGF